MTDDTLNRMQHCQLASHAPLPGEFFILKIKIQLRLRSAQMALLRLARESTHWWGPFTLSLAPKCNLARCATALFFSLSFTALRFPDVCVCVCFVLRRPNSLSLTLTLRLALPCALAALTLSTPTAAPRHIPLLPVKASLSLLLHHRHRSPLFFIVAQLPAQPPIASPHHLHLISSQQSCRAGVHQCLDTHIYTPTHAQPSRSQLTVTPAAFSSTIVNLCLEPIGPSDIQ